MSDLQVIAWPIEAKVWDDHLTEIEHFHDFMAREFAKMTVGQIKANRDALEERVAHTPSFAAYQLLDIYRRTAIERSPEHANDDKPVEWI